jgi:hypothetical protein
VTPKKKKERKKERKRNEKKIHSFLKIFQFRAGCRMSIECQHLEDQSRKIWSSRLVWEYTPRPCLKKQKDK